MRGADARSSLAAAYSAYAPSVAARAREPAQVVTWRGYPGGADARRERVTVVLDAFVKLLGESGGGSVCQVDVHGPDIGLGSAVAKAGAALPIMVPSVETIASPWVICGKAEYSAFPNARQPCLRPRRRGDRVKQIVDAKAQFRSLAEPWADTGTRRLMIAVLGDLADGDRDLIRTRTAEGRSRTQKRGQYMGRPPKLTAAQIAEARRRRAQGATLAELARSYDVVH
jgi:hypothetical protein